MSKTKKNYNTSFKEKTEKLNHVREGVNQISEELDIPYSVLSTWRKESAILG